MADQWAVPTSDLATGGWTNASGASALTGSIDEAVSSVSDADYIISPAVPADATCRFSMTGLSTPVAGAVTIWIRALVGRSVPTPFVWDAVAGATHYVFQVGLVPSVWSIYNASVGYVTNYEIRLAPGTYWARIVAYNGALVLDTTDPQSVTVT